MPFDGFATDDRPDATPGQLAIDKVLAFFGPEGERWIKGQAWIGAGACLAEALYRFGEEGVPAVLRVLGMKQLNDIPSWNDNPERTFADVKSVLLHARSVAGWLPRVAPPIARVTVTAPKWFFCPPPEVAWQGIGSTGSFIPVKESSHAV